MNKIESVLNEIRKETDEIILFTSLTGKDSILLTYFCALIFKRVVCVYEYVVKDLQHVQKWQKYFENRFPNIEYLHVPHYCLGSYIKTGYLGIAQDKTQRLYTLAQLNNLIIEKTGIKWTCFGMKQCDSLNRRLQLKRYEGEAICRETRKVYPLSSITNRQILSLLDLYRLPKPIKYNNKPSQGQDIHDIDYLSWLLENHPDDLNRTIATFPLTKLILYEEAERAKTV